MTPQPRGAGAVVVRGECPSVHAPFAEVDGALMRVRLPGGILPAAAGRALGDLAARVGAGPFELTNRANVQLRSVPHDAVDVVRRALVETGLALVDAGADERRNVLASPTAGVDPDELIDVRPIVCGVAARLASASGAGLSPKFGVIVDGGGAVHVRGRAHDLALGAVRGADGPVRFEVRLAAPLPRAVAPDDLVPVVEPERVRTLVDAVLDASRPFGRVSTLLEAVGRAEVWTEIDRRAPGVVRWVPGAEVVVAPAVAESVVGVRAARAVGTASVGAAAVLGRLTPETLAAVSDLAVNAGAPEVRVSPWRSVVLVGVAAARADAVVAECERLGLVCDAEDPATAVVACIGAVGCAEGRADVQADARRFLARLARSSNQGRVRSIHVSGCAKGCARSDPADVSLVAQDGGTYDVYQRGDDGASPDNPRFGMLEHRALDADAAIEFALTPRPVP